MELDREALPDVDGDEVFLQPNHPVRFVEVLPAVQDEEGDLAFVLAGGTPIPPVRPVGTVPAARPPSVEHSTEPSFDEAWFQSDIGQALSTPTEGPVDGLLARAGEAFAQFFARCGIRIRT